MRPLLEMKTSGGSSDLRTDQVSDQIWLVSFMDYDLGYFDDETCRLEPIANPRGREPRAAGSDKHRTGSPLTTWPEPTTSVFAGLPPS